MWLGQGGGRLQSARKPAPDSPEPVGDRTEDRFWKFGVFYFNRDDPSMMDAMIGVTDSVSKPACGLRHPLCARAPRS